MNLDQKNKVAEPEVTCVKRRGLLFKAFVAMAAVVTISSFMVLKSERLAAKESGLGFLQEEEEGEEEESTVGKVMPDGTIYVGTSPVTREAMYVTPQDAPELMSVKQALKYAKKFKSFNRSDWRMPTKDELDLIFQNRKEGSLKKTLNLTGAVPTGWYWSATPYIGENVWAQRFADGAQHHFDGSVLLAVRLVR